MFAKLVGRVGMCIIMFFTTLKGNWIEVGHMGMDCSKMALFWTVLALAFVSTREFVGFLCFLAIPGKRPQCVQALPDTVYFCLNPSLPKTNENGGSST